MNINFFCKCTINIVALQWTFYIIVRSSYSVCYMHLRSCFFFLSKIWRVQKGTPNGCMEAHLPLIFSYRDLNSRDSWTVKRMHISRVLHSVGRYGNRTLNSKGVWYVGEQIQMSSCNDPFFYCLEGWLGCFGNLDVYSDSHIFKAIGQQFELNWIWTQLHRCRLHRESIWIFVDAIKLKNFLYCTAQKPSGVWIRLNSFDEIKVSDWNPSWNKKVGIGTYRTWP